MSEISEARAEQIFKLFLPYYNSHNSKKFLYLDRQFDFPRNGVDIDFYFSNQTDGKLSIQHTRVVGNADKEYKEDRIINDLIAEIRSVLEEKGVKVSISISFNCGIPNNQKDLFVGYLCRFVESKFRKGQLSSFNFFYDDDWCYFSKIAPYLLHFDVREADSLRIGFSTSFGGSYGVIDPRTALLNAYERKLGKISSDSDKVQAQNIVLLLDCERSFLDDSGQKLKEDQAFSKSPFAQVWVISTAKPGEGTWRLDG